MAILYWQGSLTGANRFNFNYAPNWRIQTGNNFSTFTNWPLSLTAPRGNDTVKVGEYFTALSPCLYGGYSGSVAGGSWNYGAANTTTGNSGLDLFIFYNWVRPEESSVSNWYTDKYPFPYFGGGITGQIQDYCVNQLGFNASELTGITADRANNGLKLKVKGTVNIRPTGRISPSFAAGGVDGSGYPNYTTVDIKLVTDKGYNQGNLSQVYTNLTLPWSILDSAPIVSSSIIAPWYKQGYGNVIIDGGSFRSVNFNNGIGLTNSTGILGSSPKPLNLQLKNCTVQSATVDTCNLSIDRSCTFGTLTVRNSANPYNPVANSGEEVSLYPYGIFVDGKFNSVAASQENGWGITGVSGAFISGVFLYDPFTMLAGNTNFDYDPTIHIGNIDAGTTFTAQSVNVFSNFGPFSGGTTGNQTRRWNISMLGSSTITTMSLENATLKASESIQPSGELSITNLHLSKTAALDLASNPGFDKWYFGQLSITGGNTVVGGINFSDDRCRIIGSENVRLYNTKIVNGFDIRSQQNVPVLFEPLEPGPGGW